jgi:mono/diheme cytochrome c family protein
VRHLILLFASTCASAAAAQSAADGEAAYLRAGCHACHGTVGHGGAGPKLAPSTLALPAFEAWVRNGTPGWSFMSGMPAYPPAVLSDAELAAVRAYLAALPPPRSPDDIPLLGP